MFFHLCFDIKTCFYWALNLPLNHCYHWEPPRYSWKDVCCFLNCLHLHFILRFCMFLAVGRITLCKHWLYEYCIFIAFFGVWLIIYPCWMCSCYGYAGVLPTKGWRVSWGCREEKNAYMVTAVSGQTPHYFNTVQHKTNKMLTKYCLHWANTCVQGMHCLSEMYVDFFFFVYSLIHGTNHQTYEQY